MGLIKNILVYIDDSDNSIAAMEYAILLAKNYDAKLYGLFVVNTKALHDLLTAHIFVETEQAEYAQELRADADRYLRMALKLAQSKGVAIETEKVEGSIATEIRNFCEQKNIDLLVLSSDDDTRSKSYRDEFRSSKDLAARRVSCNVLIVKDENLVENEFQKEI